MAEKKCIYTIDPVKANVVVSQTLPDGSTGNLTLEMDASLKDVARRLALMGLVMYLQRATTKNKTLDPFEVIEKSYKDLQEQGLKAFERKSTPQVSGRNGPTKAQRLAALAVMYNTTIAVIKEKLKLKTPEEVDAILTSEKVTAKVAEMQAAGDITL